MSTTRGVGFLLGVLVVGLAIAPIAGSALDDHGGTDQSTNESTTDSDLESADADAEAAADGEDGAESDADSSNDSDAEPETDFSTFMQSSAAAADNEVESGLFDAKFENADDESRADVVTDRADRLESELASLEKRYESLQERQAKSNVSPVAYDAQLTRLSVKIASLESSIDRAESRAERTGVDTDRFDDLRGKAAGLNRPEVAATASSIPGVGPPENRGPADDETGASDDAPGRSGNGSPPSDSDSDDERGGSPPQADSDVKAPSQPEEDSSDSE